MRRALISSSFDLIALLAFACFLFCHPRIETCNGSVCSGIKVDKVHPKDLFALAGIKAGMVITSVNGTAVYDHESAMDMMKEAKFLKEDERILIIGNSRQVCQPPRPAPPPFPG